MRVEANEPGEAFQETEFSRRASTNNKLSWVTTSQVVNDFHLRHNKPIPTRSWLPGAPLIGNRLLDATGRRKAALRILFQAKVYSVNHALGTARTVISNRLWCI